LCLLIRHILLTCKSYDEALTLITKVPLIAPCYIIIAGARLGEGAQVTRGRYIEDGVRLTLTTTPFLIQTNIDHWKDNVDPVWAGDDFLLHNALKRKKVGIEYLANMKANDNINEDNGFNFLQVKPIFNRETVFSVVMIPSQGIYKTWIYDLTE